MPDERVTGPARLEELRRGIRQRLGALCRSIPADEFDAMVERMARVQYKYEFPNGRPPELEMPVERASLRDFLDDTGRRWKVWATHPSGGAGSVGVQASYRGGWLTFDTPGEVRRLVPIPDGWDRCSTAQLQQLLARAEPAPRRRMAE